MFEEAGLRDMDPIHLMPTWRNMGSGKEEVYKKERYVSNYIKDTCRGRKNKKLSW
jgi:hypothetical protein